jgi:hypothetical protein
MRFEGPLYEGDSVLRPGPAFSQDLASGASGAPEAAEIVQRGIAPKPVGEGVDLQAIEARARALRAEAIRTWVASLVERLTQWLESGRRRRDEEYLAKSQTHAELEARMRELERRGYVPHL